MSGRANVASGWHGGGGLRYTGTACFTVANKAPVAGVLVELVEAEDDGKPTDEVLGSTRADAEGHFTVVLDRNPPSRDKPVALVVSAVRTISGQQR